MNLKLSQIDRLLPLMRKKGVSKVARGQGGFLSAYRRAKGRLSHLTPYWKNRRKNFIKRHMAQVRKRREPLFTPDGKPTRRHLALVAWAYSPSKKKLFKR